MGLVTVMPAAINMNPAWTNHDPAAPAEAFVPGEDQIRHEIDQVFGVVLSPELTAWAQRYAAIGRRHPFLWNWCRQAVEVTTLPCVGADWMSEVCDTKTLGVMWVVLLDDLADQNGPPHVLEALLEMPQTGRRPSFGHLPADLRAYAELAVEVWEEIMRRVREYPLFPENRDILRFDYLQVCNVMRYSHLLNARPELLNLTEHDQFTPYNMHVMVHSTVDVMVSPSFDPWERGLLREIVWHTQWMGRIGNLVTTWEREVGEKDFTSGVFARTVSSGGPNAAQLTRMTPDELRQAIRNGGHESFFLERWQNHRRFLLSRVSVLRSFDLMELVRRYERLICLHLGSRGKK